MKDYSLLKELLSTGFAFGVVVYIFAYFSEVSFEGIHENSREFVNMIVAVLMTTLTGVVGYMFGYKEGKKQKDENTNDTGNNRKDR